MGQKLRSRVRRKIALCPKPLLPPSSRNPQNSLVWPRIRAATDVVHAIINELKKSGGFTLPSFGTFRVVKTKARKALNPRTGEPVKVKAGKTVRFKVSPTLKKAV